MLMPLTRSACSESPRARKGIKTARARPGGRGTQSLNHPVPVRALRLRRSPVGQQSGTLNHPVPVRALRRMVGSLPLPRPRRASRLSESPRARKGIKTMTSVASAAVGSNAWNSESPRARKGIKTPWFWLITAHIVQRASESPRARKGIKTIFRPARNGGVCASESPRARKGIKTFWVLGRRTPAFCDALNHPVPVRALRLQLNDEELDAIVKSSESPRARKGIKTNFLDCQHSRDFKL